MVGDGLRAGNCARPRTGGRLDGARDLAEADAAILAAGDGWDGPRRPRSRRAGP